VLHTFTYCNALHQALRRSPSPELARGIVHGALRLYLDRFLNMPAAHLPGDRDVVGLPEEANALRDRLLDAMDQQQRVAEAARLVYQYQARGHEIAPLLATLGQGLLREDAEFHSYQMYEAAVRQHGQLRADRPAHARIVLVAAARYLAAHAPTARAMLQTARIGLRLHRGDDLTQDESE
ncbi:MAG TPA: Rieske (2Fe-2S) protein, partial [Chloroflexota bacterium]|nr:Rieske (2Fe-2S) protein [Chloroflexota bacterium]